MIYKFKQIKSKIFTKIIGFLIIKEQYTVLILLILLNIKEKNNGKNRRFFSDASNKITILALDGDKYRGDLTSLSHHPKIRVLFMNQRPPGWLIKPFYSELDIVRYINAKKNSDDAIKQAAEAANALDFIEKSPEGFNTLIGERGVNLSGGQKQRLAIARALLKNPPILILDEATSALDTESEKKVQNAIENLMKDRTALVIAHRLSTVQNADKIIVINEGHVVEMGTHNQLYENDGLYRRLYDIQFD